KKTAIIVLAFKYLQYICNRQAGACESTDCLIKSSLVFVLVEGGQLIALFLCFCPFQTTSIIRKAINPTKRQACTPSCRKLELKHANTLSYQEIELFLQEITSYYTQQG
ncbi:hypothetical protein, partial [Prevotella pectinovora]|uniref:hypothetical protein n=1 Tax=Prevotella pectinovora TaxID=1602169 RepID=UPI003A94BFCE